MRKDRGRWKGVTYKTDDSKGGVDLAFNAVAYEEYRDKEYAIEIPEDNKTTEQGLLTLGRLEPLTGHLPRFLFRWDGKAKHVNVDIKGVNDTVRKWFERGENGYIGHVAQKDNDRLFDVDIQIPGKHVFKGRISFNLGYGYEFIAIIGLKAD